MGSLLVGVLLFARHNLALGRGDRRGASALALTVFCGSMAASLLEGHYVASSNAGVILPYVVISASLFLAAVAWTCYIALEPAVRRKWPQTLIGWSRLVAGQWRDPVVCAHVLVGLAAGLLTTALALASDLPGPQAGHSPDTGGLAALQGTRFVLSQSILLTVVSPVVNSVINFFLLFLFKLVLRRDWLTAVAFVGLFSLRAALGTNPWFDVPLLLALNSIAVFVMVRFGLLGFAGWALGQSVAERIPLTFDFGAWYGGPSLFAMALVLGLAAFNFRTAVGGRNPRP
jgi:serine/threonine-protein kinase